MGGHAPVYGQSVTDACIGWEDTERVLRLVPGPAANGPSFSEMTVLNESGLKPRIFHVSPLYFTVAVFSKKKMRQRSSII